MAATAAADESGVEYAFECVAGPCHDSGWQDAPTWEDTGLAPDHEVVYRVRARDRSLNRNETAWSEVAAATTAADEGFAAGLDAQYYDFAEDLPELPPLGGLLADVTRVDRQVAWPPTAEPWTDLDGGFADTFAVRHTGFLRVVTGGSYTLFLAADEGARLWLGGEPVLDTTGAAPLMEAAFTRELAPGYHPIRLEAWENEGDAALVLSWSGPDAAQKEPVPTTALYRASPPDLEPPQPDPPAWESPPAPTGPGSIAMTAAAAADRSGVQYAFECVQGGCHDSGWRFERTWEDTGLAPGAEYVYRVRARDLSVAENETAASADAGAWTDTFVPDVLGLARTAAGAALSAARLTLGTVTEEYSDTVPADHVIAQDPVPGAQLPASAAVNLTISLGIEPVPVPDVTGLPREAAEAALVAARLRMGGVLFRDSCTVAPGAVISQDPAAGGTAPKGSAVNLVVSLGPKTVVISEIMYHPEIELAPEEFLELHNPCAYPVGLVGWRVHGVTDFVFGPGTSIDAGAYLVLAQDAAAFETAYGFAPDYVYTAGILDNGGETLRLLDPAGAIVDEVTYDDVPPWPVTPDGMGPSLEVVCALCDNATPRNWHASIDVDGHTAGAPNSVQSDALPPWVTGVGHGTPAADVPLTVTATVLDATDVTLTYVIAWGTPVTLPLLDDGASGDGAAGDGVYGAVIPAQPLNTLIRYRLDATGPGGAMGYPRDDDTVRYTGTFLVDPALSSDLVVIHWLMDPARYAAALAHYNTNQVEPALVFHNGVLYDGVEVRVRGQSSRGWPKKHWKIDFPQGHDFADARLAPFPVPEFNLQSSYADKAYVRELLSYETFRAAGCPSHAAAPVRVHQNGQFFGLYTWLEAKDGRYLDRQGLDERGALYKAYAQGEYATLETMLRLYEKQSPEDGDYTDIHAFLTGVNTLTGQARRDFIFDNVDIPGMLSYLAANTIIHNNDQVAKNYYFYRDTYGTGRWVMQPWDMDLTFGRSFQGAVLNDVMFADEDVVAGRPNVSPSHPLFGDSEHQKWDYLWNRVTDALYEDPDIRRMYYRRLRTLLDELLVEGHFEARIDELVPLITDDAESDRLKWGQYGVAQTLAQAVAILKADYLAVRRVHLFQTHRVDGEIPEAQSADPPIVITELMYNPYVDPNDPTAVGADREFVELYNPSPGEAVDLSGWQLVGAGLVIPAGTVILPQSYLLVASDDPTFRATYGSGHFVAAEYDGQLDNGGERITLLSRTSAIVDQVTYDDAAPWPVTPDGQGPSLELVDPASDNALPASWAPSLAPGGTPGAPNSVTPPAP